MDYSTVTLFARFLGLSKHSPLGRQCYTRATAVEWTSVAGSIKAPLLDLDSVIGLLADGSITRSGHGDDDAISAFHFFNIRHHFLIQPVLRRDGDYRHLCINQCNRTVFHLSSRVSF